MDRSLAVRRVAPVAVFAAVLGGIVLVNGRSTTGRDPRPLPIQAAGSNRGEDSATGAGAPAMAPAYWSETRIPDRLLAGVPTEGPAYVLTADDSRVEALARALGVDGKPSKQADGTWTVGSGDTVLHVMPYAGQPWYLGASKGVGREPGTVTATAEPVTDPAGPETAKPDQPTSSSGPTPGDKQAYTTPCPMPPPGAEPACVVPQPLPPTMPPQPMDATARAVMDRILAALGQQDAAVTMAPGYMGKEVTAAPVVSGLPTSGYETRATVAADGTIAYANGFLARLRLDATYPLLDPRKSVERGGIGYARDLPAGRPVPDGPAATAHDAPAVAPATAPASSGPGDSIEPAPATASPVPDEPRGSDQPKAEPTPVVREATTLRLGLMFMPSYEDTRDAFLVPAWLLGFEGSTWEEPFLALPDEYLAKPPAPSGDPDRPVCDPSPCPDAPPPPDGNTSGNTSGSTSGGGSGGYDPGAPKPSAS